MRTMFNAGFRQPFEAHRMGLGQGGGILPLLTEGLQAWKTYEQSEIAEDQRKAQEAQRQALLKQQQIAAQQAATQAAANPTILGMPRDTAIVGGIALLLVVGIAAFLKSS